MRANPEVTVIRTGMSGTRPALRLIESTDDGEEFVWFCGHCAAPAPNGEAPAPNARVCAACGLGLLLESRGDAAPTTRDAFLVVDSRLLVQAVSRRAETLLGVSEAHVVDRPVSELLVPADAEAAAATAFAAAVARALGDDEPSVAVVRPWNTFGVRIRAKLSSCGPPRAALIVLQPPGPQLRVLGGREHQLAGESTSGTP